MVPALQLLNILCVISYFGTGIEATHTHALPKKGQKYHVDSNWSIRLLASQGVLIHPVTLPAFAESSFSLEFQIQIHNGNPSISFASPWKSNRTQLIQSRPHIEDNKSEDWIPGSYFHALVLDQLESYVYGNLSSELKQWNLEVSIPAEHFSMYSSKSELYEPDLSENLYFEGTYRMRLSIPTRRADQGFQMVKVKFVDFFLEPNKTCSGRLWFNQHVLVPEPLALVKGQDIHLVYPKVAYVNVSHQINCDPFLCFITKEAQETMLTEHPCLSSIQRDAPVQDVEEACNVPCATRYNSAHHRPSVIELGEKLTISGITQPIVTKCLNSSHNQILEVPPGGALEMRIRCGCQLFHNSQLLWSRIEADPKFCTTDDQAYLEVYQLLPSSFIRFQNDFENFSTVHSSALEGKIFFNLSGIVVAEEVLDQMTNDILQAELTKWGAIVLALICVCTPIAYAIDVHPVNWLQNCLQEFDRQVQQFMDGRQGVAQVQNQVVFQPPPQIFVFWRSRG